MTPTSRHGNALGPVVAGVDGSASSREAVLWAAGEADRRGQHLRLVLGADLDRLGRFAAFETTERLREAGGTHLAEAHEAVHERFPGLPVERELSNKNAVAALQEAAAPDATVVVGSRGLGGFPALLLGSVSLAVATRSSVPVVVVRGRTDRPGTGVVAAAVRDETDADWVRRAAAEAELRGGTLHLINVWNPLSHVGNMVTALDDPGDITEQGRARTDALAAVVHRSHPALTVTTATGAGTATAAALMDVSGRADLLVMGVRRRFMGSGPALGRLGHAALHHARCPVEIVPRPGEPEQEESWR
ncbi:MULTISPECIES: universal stress protein [unclassified Streptomyces]|uniref:universal stress protein n=1 Tax=unclassified Streptomyces TaxID=2593676 RepID=UPI0005AB44FE|nr:universal stress protein [Streptomyces sp. NBRC 110035]